MASNRLVGWLLSFGLANAGVAQFQSCAGVDVDFLGWLAADDEPWTVATGDLNGDGNVDVVMPNYRASFPTDTLTIWFGLGDGTFLPGPSPTVGAGPFGVAIGDLNGDAVLDVVTAKRIEQGVSILIGIGDGTFLPAQTYPGGESLTVVIADLTGDDVLDLCVTESNQARTLVGVGDGTFLPGTTLAVSGQGVYSADLDDNGFNDLIFDCPFLCDEVFAVAMNAGNGAFTLHPHQLGLCEARYLAVADFDGDGIEDVVASSFNDSCFGQPGGPPPIATYVGVGDGTFLAPSYSNGPFPFSPTCVAAADVDVDGTLDVVITSDFPNRTQYARGLGDGSFGPVQGLYPGGKPKFVAIADLDNNGIDDILAANSTAKTVSVLINYSAVQATHTYCTSKVNSQGCVPAIDSIGVPGLSEPGPFSIGATGVLNQKPGIFFYGLSGPLITPFLGGTLCVRPPVRRSPVLFSSGNPPPDNCSGSYTFDFNAWAQGGSDPNLIPGAGVNGQYWSRDPAHPDGTGSGLTDAIGFGLCP